MTIIFQISDATPEIRLSIRVLNTFDFYLSSLRCIIDFVTKHTVVGLILAVEFIVYLYSFFLDKLKNLKY